MKRIISISLLSIMMVLLTLPFFEQKENKNVKYENKIQDIELDVGASKIIFSKPNIEKWNVGWTVERVNLRTKPSFESEVIVVCEFNNKIIYKKYNDNWYEVSVNIDGEYIDGYIRDGYISNKQCEYEECDFPDNRGFKSYMSYTTLTNKASNQYELQEEHGYTVSGMRMVNNRYCIAIGTAFNADIGTYVDLTLDNGEVIPCIVADIKADIHTRSDNITTTSNGCVVEFLVDTKKMDKQVKRSGDVSEYYHTWDSAASRLKVYNKNILQEE